MLSIIHPPLFKTLLTPLSATFYQGPLDSFWSQSVPRLSVHWYLPKVVMILRTTPVETQSFRMKSANNPLMGTSRANSMYGMAEKTPSNTIDCCKNKKLMLMSGHLYNSCKQAKRCAKKKQVGPKHCHSLQATSLKVSACMTLQLQ